MCGICGIISKNFTPITPEEIGKMCSTLVHRGPDDEGIYISDSIGLGMRRLKVIDLDTGHQPVHNEDETIWIVFNGEIYNYQELRKTLEQLGHSFYTKSDTEVIIHLYEEYGVNAPKYLNGMFCFAIWDSNKQQIFIARDRLGIKQLYFYEDEQQIIFGSEIKAVLSNSKVEKNLNIKAFRDYFSFLYVPAPHTIYSKINKLPPASTMLIRKGKIKFSKYWSLRYDKNYLTGNDAINCIIEQLSKSIKYRMISDVPIGAYLSGGIDSSIIVAIMSSLTTKPIETFSIIWDQASGAFDERKYAKEVSCIYNTNHHEFLVKPDIEEVTMNIIECFDEPFADASAIPNYYLAKETKKFVTVALSGLGGDEMAAGYERYLGMKLAKYFNFIPYYLRENVIKKLVGNMPDSKKGRHFNNRLKRFVSTCQYPFIDRYFNIISTFTNDYKNSLFDKSVIDNNNSSVEYFNKYDRECNSANELNRMLCIDLHTYLVDDLLVLTDRMSMCHSLEVRVPFLDHNLVEHFAMVDPAMKLKFFSKKYLLKKIAEKYLPKSLIYRKKMGFSVPLVLWFRNELKDYVLYVLNKKSVEKVNLFNYEALDRILKEHFCGKANNDEKIWSIMIFMLWYDKYIQKIY